MALDTTQNFTRRLSFNEVTANLLQDPLELRLKTASIEGFREAAQALAASIEQRIEAIEGVAREQCEAVGEADLRRLKRQFSSLKNTFLHYEVKQSFITGLSEGLPSGSEAEELAAVEEEVASNVTALRALKQQNEQTAQAIVEVAERIGDVREAFDRARRGVAADLGRLEQDLAQHVEQLGGPMAELAEGAREEELRTVLATAASATREDEYKIAAELALGQELEAALACEQAELEMLEVRLAELEAVTAVQGEKVETDVRLRSALDKCDAVAALVGLLSGLRVLNATPDLVQLQLSTCCPAGSSGATASSAEHVLALQLVAGTRQVEVALLSPADVEVGDLVEAAAAGERRLDWVVQEVQVRLAAWLAVAAAQ